MVRYLVRDGLGLVRLVATTSIGAISVRLIFNFYSSINLKSKIYQTVDSLESLKTALVEFKIWDSSVGGISALGIWSIASDNVQVLISK